MKSLLEELKDGDFRSIRKANEVTKFALANPRFFKEIFQGITNTDPLIKNESGGYRGKSQQTTSGIFATIQKATYK
jgi:hypothetical protein